MKLGGLKVAGYSKFKWCSKSLRNQQFSATHIRTRCSSISVLHSVIEKGWDPILLLTTEEQIMVLYLSIFIWDYGFTWFILYPKLSESILVIMRNSHHNGKVFWIKRYKRTVFIKQNYSIATGLNKILHWPYSWTKICCHLI